MSVNPGSTFTISYLLEERPLTSKTDMGEGATYDLCYDCGKDGPANKDEGAPLAILGGTLNNWNKVEICLCADCLFRIGNKLKEKEGFINGYD